MKTVIAKYQSPTYTTGLQRLPRKPCAHLSQQVLEGRTVSKRVCNTCHKVLENTPRNEGVAE